MAGKGRGKQLETEIARCNRKYQDNLWAFVVRQEVPVVAIGRKLRRTKAAIPDFMGFVKFRGQSIPVLFDAKETHRRRWPIRSGGGLEEHQIEDADDLELFSDMIHLLFAEPNVPLHVIN